jgi:hypothetical protein
MLPLWDVNNMKASFWDDNWHIDYMNNLIWHDNWHIDDSGLISSQGSGLCYK